jgi:23S rRNA (cytidine2498-2'-O)-methyltransferase
VTNCILTCSPYFTELALNEIRRQHPQISITQHLAPGIIQLQAPYSFDKLTVHWRHQTPIYLHHAFPIHATILLTGQADDPERMKMAASQIAADEVTVQVRSTIESGLPYSARDVQQFLNPSQTAYNTDLPKGRILSVLITRLAGELCAYMGISWATQNISPWAGGELPVTEAVPNRAGYKLLEAISAFSIRLRKGDMALDLGASPGAWTTLLRRRGLRVTAVAPTPLYPWLTIDPDVNYQPLLAEDFLNRCPTTFDLMVNDMYMEPQKTAQLMVDYARQLRREGIAIVTLKLRERNQRRVMDHSFRILRKAYKIIQVRQLVSNRKEVTLFLRRKD